MYEHTKNPTILIRIALAKHDLHHRNARLARRKRTRGTETPAPSLDTSFLLEDIGLPRDYPGYLPVYLELTARAPIKKFYNACRAIFFADPRELTQIPEKVFELYFSRIEREIEGVSEKIKRGEDITAWDISVSLLFARVIAYLSPDNIERTFEYLEDLAFFARGAGKKNQHLVDFLRQFALEHADDDMEGEVNPEKPLTVYELDDKGYVAGYVDSVVDPLVIALVSEVGLMEDMFADHENLPVLYDIIAYLFSHGCGCKSVAEGYSKKAFNLRDAQPKEKNPV